MERIRTGVSRSTRYEVRGTKTRQRLEALTAVNQEFFLFFCLDTKEPKSQDGNDTPIPVNGLDEALVLLW